MQNFIISIYDIKDITKPLFLKEFPIEADDKSIAQDMAHTIAFEKFPKIKCLVTTRTITA